VGDRLEDSALVLEGLCNAAAVLDTGTPRHVLAQLVSLYMARLEDQSPMDFNHLREALQDEYHVDLLPDDLRQVLDGMEAQGKLLLAGNDLLGMASEARANVLRECAEEQALEDRVRAQWLAELSSLDPALPGDAFWLALEEFMQSAFARHGMQTVVLLDPAVQTDDAHEVSLSALQAKSISRHVPEQLHTVANRQIALFFMNASKDVDRTSYIGRLADTAHAFFTLHVSPSVASTMSAELAPLVVFLDTNFLFAFMGLHSRPFIEVADRLVDAVAANKLPIKLRYHEATAAELRSTLAYYKRELGGKRWAQGLSRAAVKVGAVSGVELEYHRRNGSTPTDVAVFFRPLEHFDVLLRDRGVDIYRGSQTGEDDAPAILADYQRELAEMGREKPEAAMEHDASVLATVRALRSEAKSTIEAGALLVTCDYTLFRYDSRAARRTGVLVSVLLPNMLWQILRYFVPSSLEYDRAFAETFALPEFRTIQSRSGRAASKMLSLLAAYGDLPEATAVRMLSNDVLLKQLAAETSDDEAATIIGSEIVRLNQQLVEETALFATEAKEAAAKRAELENANRELESKVETERERAEFAAAEAARHAKEAERIRLAAGHDAAAAAESVRQAETETAQEKGRREAAESATRSAKTIGRRKAIASAAVVAVLLIAVQLLLWFGLQWPQWIVTHKHGVGMQLVLMAASSALAFAAFVPEWRKWLLGVFGLMLLAAFLQYL